MKQDLSLTGLKNHIDTMDKAAYASYCLDKCWNKTELINEADASIYRELVFII